MNLSEPKPLTWIGRTARLVAGGLLGYWGLFALLAPVTVWDSHVYNLGRLPLAELGGLWSNPFWTSERQVVFPLAFDAIHLPLLHLGAAFALPSYLCLLGILIVAWATLRRWHDADTAWLGVLALLSLPTLAFQAVGNKNDLAVVFGLAVWFHALVRWRKDQRIWHLGFAAAATGFTAGAKSSGVIVALLCGLATLWALRRHRGHLVAFAALAGAAVVLLGSVETYLISQRTYSHPLGSAGFVREHRNNDGLRGAAANVLRYTAGNITTGIEPWLERDPLTPWLEHRCRELLHGIGLADVGYRRDFNDSRLSFSRKGWDSASDYGPVGTMALLLAAFAAIGWRHRAPWWRMAMAGNVLFGTVALTVAWMPWNNRFLIGTFVLWTLAVASFLAKSGHRHRQVFLLVVASLAAVAYPLASYNKRPGDLAAALLRPEAQEFKERATLLPVISAVRDWRKLHPGGEVFMVAGSDSWVLPFLTTGMLAVRPVPLTQLRDELAAKQRLPAPALVLVLNREDFRRFGLPLKELARFPDEPGTALYELLPPSVGVDLPTLAWEHGRFADGWSAPESALAVEHWTSGRLTLTLWNPTPLARTLRINTRSSEQVIEFSPGDHRLVSLNVAMSDVISLSVTPVVVPRALGLAEDDRRLGLHVMTEN